MKILCLILASDTAPEYVQFQTLWRKFMDQNSRVDCYFYKSHPNLQHSEFLEDKTLWIQMPESLETVYAKTLRAFEYFVPQLEAYDYVYRSNLSTFVSFDHMLEFCKDLPRSNCCAAVTGGIPRGSENRYSLEHVHSFPGGNGFILSPDLVRRIVQERPPLIEQDDVSIGAALRNWKIPIVEFVRPDYLEHGSWYMNNPQLLKSNEWNLEPKKIMFTYRLKSFDRTKDILIMKELITRVYGV